MQAAWLSKLCISRKCWSSPQVQLQCWRSSDLTCLGKAVIPKKHSQSSFMWFWREAFLKRIQGSGHLSIWPGDTKRFPELLQYKVRLSQNLELPYYATELWRKRPFGNSLHDALVAFRLPKMRTFDIILKS